MVLKIQLESLGLSERESRVYLALLDLGPTTTSKLIRKTGIASSKIYDVLEKLKHKGLATHIFRNGKRQFQAAPPEKLADLLKEKEAVIQDILPSLQKLYTRTAEEVQAEIYTGKEGIKAIFEDILAVGRDWYVLGASGKGALTLPYYTPHFYRRLQKQKIKASFLWVDTEVTRKQDQELRQYKNIATKFLPPQIRNLMATFVYGQTVVIIPITETVEVSPLAILIKSRESADSYTDYFKWLWKICR